MQVDSAVDPTGDFDGRPLDGDSAPRAIDESGAHGQATHSPGTVESREMPGGAADPRGDFDDTPIEVRAAFLPAPGPPQSYAESFHTPGTADTTASGATEVRTVLPPDAEPN